MAEYSSNLVYSNQSGALNESYSDIFGEALALTNASGTADSGGVHTNSGAPNKAFALMVDGGTFNGKTVAAIGIDQAVQIEYRANNTYLTSSAKMLDNYNALKRACGDLYGTGSATCTTSYSSLFYVDDVSFSDAARTRFLDGVAEQAELAQPQAKPEVPFGSTDEKE